MENVVEQGSVFTSIINDFLKNSGSGILDFAVSLVIAILILVIGFKCIKYVVNFCKRVFERSNMDPTLEGFLLSGIKIGLKVLILFWAITKIGVAASSVIALLGSTCLALGLSLQGSLANLAGGVILLFMKPFETGDYIIESGSGKEGTVDIIGIMYTRLKTVDNKVVLIPNGNLLASTIVNTSKPEFRQEDITVGIEYSESIARVREALNKVIDAELCVQRDQKIEVFVNSFQDSCIEMRIRFWVKNDDYWTCRWRTLENIKEEFDKENISIPYNRLDVSITKE